MSGILKENVFSKAINYFNSILTKKVFPFFMENGSLKEEIKRLVEQIKGLRSDLEGLKSLFTAFSTGNEGVQTDSQQTDSQQLSLTNTLTGGSLKPLGKIVDLLKTDLKKRFKSLTKQEFYIFSLLYSLEAEKKAVSYTDLTKKSGFSGSYIRDCVGRLIKKGIPILKNKISNKYVILRISPDLRNIATLESLLKIRNKPLV